MNTEQVEKWKKAVEMATKNKNLGSVATANVLLSQTNAKPVNRVPAMQPLEKAFALLNLPKSSSVAEAKAAYKKKVIAYASSASASGKLEEINGAFVEIIEYFQQKALQQGSEDPESAEILQKCEEYLPGQVKAKSGTLVIKLKHNGAVWKKAIKQKFPGAINVNASKSSSKAKSRKIRSERGNTESAKFVLTWRPSNDYIHLKVNLQVTESTLLVSGQSYILWATENYGSMCKLADDIVAKEGEIKEEIPEIDDSEKMDEIIKCLRILEVDVKQLNSQLTNLSEHNRGMRVEVDRINTRLDSVELNQETSAQSQLKAHAKLDDLTVKAHEIRQLAGARTLAEGKSAAFIINKNPPPAHLIKSSSTIGLSKKFSETGTDESNGRNSNLPSPRRKQTGSSKKKSISDSPSKRRISAQELKKTNRMEVVESESSGYHTTYSKESMHDVMKKMEDDSDEKIEEMIDDISTNEMFGSSILSM
ncbi:uncharacterized protein LOC111706160 isoform X3 [Eurytemora carolleeae]|uniref:uncharacterized protein LOC111706160 isoform X3 n=1 Tax=Eurytemora carolleeae TaxID=1294199 RepID=UPI000C77A184|nr:uncharacterized protein LOC111706160 isoform X3 [Eurytemora carolleeae]|eukprot:XP_023334719.1 uncharacterized protein LOC111706160 isoform X3 [Eurytemora affinis]